MYYFFFTEYMMHGYAAMVNCSDKLERTLLYVRKITGKQYFWKGYTKPLIFRHIFLAWSYKKKWCRATVNLIYIVFFFCVHLSQCLSWIFFWCAFVYSVFDVFPAESVKSLKNIFKEVLFPLHFVIFDFCC